MLVVMEDLVAVVLVVLFMSQVTLFNQVLIQSLYLLVVLVVLDPTIVEILEETQQSLTLVV